VQTLLCATANLCSRIGEAKFRAFAEVTSLTLAAVQRQRYAFKSDG